jgi:pectate lyase
MTPTVAEKQRNVLGSKPSFRTIDVTGEDSKYSGEEPLLKHDGDEFKDTAARSPRIRTGRNKVVKTHDENLNLKSNDRTNDYSSDIYAAENCVDGAVTLDSINAKPAVSAKYKVDDLLSIASSVTVTPVHPPIVIHEGYAVPPFLEGKSTVYVLVIHKVRVFLITNSAITDGT